MPLPPGVVTATSTAPAACAGVVAVMVVALTTVTLVAGTPPNVTAVAPVRLVPVMVTLVPPTVVPLVGLIGRHRRGRRDIGEGRRRYAARGGNRNIDGAGRHAPA